MANAGKLSVMLLAVGASIALSFTAYAGGPPIPICGDGEVNGTEVCDGSATPDGCTSRQACNNDCTACVAPARIALCHQGPNQNAKAVTLRVSAESVAAHLAHGDALGACP